MGFFFLFLACEWLVIHKCLTHLYLRFILKVLFLKIHSFIIGNLSCVPFAILTEEVSVGRLQHLSCRKFCWMMWAWIIYVPQQSVFLLWEEFSETWLHHWLSSALQGCSNILLGAIFGYQIIQGGLFHSPHYFYIQHNKCMNLVYVTTKPSNAS